jgi:hypothetical protein
MTRHVIDHARQPVEGNRTRTYLEIDRRSGMHPAVKALHQRPTAQAAESSRLKEYTRIERGELA